MERLNRLTIGIWENGVRRYYRSYQITSDLEKLLAKLIEQGGKK